MILAAEQASAPWTATWLPFFGSLVVALVALAGVVWSSNKNAQTITETEVLRHKNVVDEAHAVATRNEKVQVLLRLIDEATRHILLTNDVIMAFRRDNQGYPADIEVAQTAFNAHGAVLTSAESAAYLYAPSSLVEAAQVIGKGAGEALDGVQFLHAPQMEALQRRVQEDLNKALSALVTAVQAELGLRPPDEEDEGDPGVVTPAATV
ncbi:hypothetical protein Cch01nite_31880 [Cellulomonas chitinilytica]|uniref:Uncharacterized protein n=1 Tax=Cellulomonas chitinilytica TaxID=398759 RepID=A0A919U3T5_9CELL|nr:hypothetical protein [Cellulomonas chitinilytica]GIG22464.1 hypothetical protein Cch01nite_31880 [Cellulomonas chitinilytica]